RPVGEQPPHAQQTGDGEEGERDGRREVAVRRSLRCGAGRRGHRPVVVVVVVVAARVPATVPMTWSQAAANAFSGVTRTTGASAGTGRAGILGPPGAAAWVRSNSTSTTEP